MSTSSVTEKLNARLEEFLKLVGVSDIAHRRDESTVDVYLHGKKQRNERDQAMKTAKEKITMSSVDQHKHNKQFVTVDLTRAQRWGVKMACRHILHDETGGLRGAIMAHSMGLGKTLIGVEVSRAFLAKHADQGVVVVAAPKMLCDQWQEELEDEDALGRRCCFEACSVAFKPPSEYDEDLLAAALHDIAPDARVGAGAVSNLRPYHVRRVWRALEDKGCSDIRGGWARSGTDAAFLAGMRIQAGKDIANEAHALPHCDYLVLTHDLFKNNHQELSNALGDDVKRLLILDEAQRAKNQNAQDEDDGDATDNLNTAVHEFPGKRLLLTATPMEINISELWALARLVVPDMSAPNANKISGIGAKLGRALHAAHGHLPPLLEVKNLIQQYQDITHRTPQVDDKFKKVVACVNTCLYAFMDRLGPSVLSKELGRVHRSEFLVTCDPDTDTMGPATLETWVTPSAARDQFLMKCLSKRRELGQGQKTIIFHWYKDYRDHVVKLMDENKIQYELLHGDMTTSARKGAIDRFKDAKATSTVLVANIQVGGVGLNLQHHANMVIFLNSDWNPANIEQAAGRIWRRGQERDCSIVHLVVTGEFSKADAPPVRIDEKKKFETMMRRVVANANFLDGKYLVGSGDAWSADPGKKHKLEEYIPQGANLTVKRIDYDLKDVVDVSVNATPPPLLDQYDVRSGNKKVARLPIYNKGDASYTSHFAELVESLREKLLQEVYYCTMHDVFFFRGEISKVPPLLYPLTTTQLERVQARIPDARFRMAFDPSVTPGLKDSLEQKQAAEAYAKRNQELLARVGDAGGGVVCLCTEAAGSDVNDDYRRQRAPLLVCLLLLLLHTKGVLPTTSKKEQLRAYLAVLSETRASTDVRAYPLLKSIADCACTTDEAVPPDRLEEQAARDFVQELQLANQVSVAEAGGTRYVLWCSDPETLPPAASMTQFPPYVYEDSERRPRVLVETPAGQSWILGDGVAELHGQVEPLVKRRIYTLWENPDYNASAPAAVQKQGKTAKDILVQFVNYNSKEDVSQLSLPGTTRLSGAKTQLVEALQRKEEMAGDDTKIDLDLVNVDGDVFRGADDNVNMGMTLQNNLKDGKIWYKIKQHQVKWIPVRALKPAVKPEELESTFRFGINVGDTKAELEKKHDRTEFTLYKDDSLSVKSRPPKPNTIEKTFKEVDGKLQIHYTAEALVQLHLTMDTAERAKQLLAKFQGGSTLLRATLSDDQVTITTMVRKGTTAQKLQKQLTDAVQMQKLRAKLSGVVDDTALEDGAGITVQFQTSAKATEMVIQEWRSVGVVPAPDVAVVNKLPKTLPADTKVADLYEQLNQEYDGHRYRWQLFEDENGKKSAVNAKLLRNVYNTMVVYYTGVKLVRVTVTNATPQDTTPSQVSFDDRLRQIARVPNTENDVYIEQGKTVGDLLALLKQKTDDDAVVGKLGGAGGLTRVLTDRDAVAVVLRPRGKVIFRVVSETDGEKLEGVEDAVWFEDQVKLGVFEKAKKQIRDKFQRLHKEQGLLLRFKPTTEPGNLQGITQFDFPASIVRKTPTLPGQGAQGGGPAPGDFIMH
jgi:hypothetical protein